MNHWTGYTLHSIRSSPSRYRLVRSPQTRSLEVGVPRGPNGAGEHDSDLAWPAAGRLILNPLRFPDAVDQGKMFAWKLALPASMMDPIRAATMSPP